MSPRYPVVSIPASSVESTNLLLSSSQPPLSSSGIPLGFKTILRSAVQLEVTAVIAAALPPALTPSSTMPPGPLTSSVVPSGYVRTPSSDIIQFNCGILSLSLYDTLSPTNSQKTGKHLHTSIYTAHVSANHTPPATVQGTYSLV